MNKRKTTHAVRLLRITAQRQRDLWDAKFALERVVDLELHDLHFHLDYLANSEDGQINEGVLQHIIKSNLNEAKQERIAEAYSRAFDECAAPDLVDMKPATNHVINTWELRSV